MRPGPQVTLEDFEEEVSDWVTKQGKHRIVVICSCPSRLGDDMAIMERVEDRAANSGGSRGSHGTLGTLQKDPLGSSLHIRNAP